MSALLDGIEAVTFDFHNTLVFNREGLSRGHKVMNYLAAQGIESAPWRHEILYEIFAGYERVGSPSAPPEERRKQRVALAERLLERLEVAAAAGEAERHAEALWKLLGPDCFAIFPDVTRTIEKLTSAGYRLAIVSNWPCGLAHFCAELGFAELFDAILCSGEIGAAKPDPRIFAEACARLRVEPARVLHVGDSVVADCEGAASAGFRAALIARDREADAGFEPAIRDLGELARDL